MKALVYHGPAQKAWELVADPTIETPTDAIVRITQLDDLRHRPAHPQGRRPRGDARYDPRPRGCRRRRRHRKRSHNPGRGRPRARLLHQLLRTLPLLQGSPLWPLHGGGGWILGHTTDGVQAELARIPFADTSLYKVPEQLSDEQVLFLADILPTAYEVGVLNGNVTPGDTVAIVGAGPIGLAAILAAKLYTPGRIVAIDLEPARLIQATRFGADATIDNGREDAIARMLELTNGLGADVAIEAVGVPVNVRALHRARPPRRPDRERRRPRPPGHAPSREALDQGRHDHHRARRHQHHAEAAAADRRRQTRPDPVRDAPLRARRDRRGLRGVRQRRSKRRAQGRAQRTPRPPRGRRGERTPDSMTPSWAKRGTKVGELEPPFDSAFVERDAYPGCMSWECDGHDRCRSRRIRLRPRSTRGRGP